MGFRFTNRKGDPGFRCCFCTQACVIYTSSVLRKVVTVVLDRNKWRGSGRPRHAPTTKRDREKKSFVNASEVLCHDHEPLDPWSPFCLVARALSRSLVCVVVAASPLYLLHRLTRLHYQGGFHAAGASPAARSCMVGKPCLFCVGYA